MVATAAYRVRSDKSAYVSNVAVDQTCRRRGIARALVFSILQELEETEHVELVTHADTYALQLYRSFGFKLESRQENYFSDGEPRLLFSLSRARV